MLETAKVKANNRLEEIVQRRYGVSLKSGTKGTEVVYSGLCPFHEERRASFFVYADKQNYHCYGCGLHGDVINFVQEMEKCGFKEALGILGSNNFDTKDEGGKQEVHTRIKKEAQARYSKAEKNSFNCKNYIRKKISGDVGIEDVKGITKDIRVDYEESKLGVELVPMIDVNGEIWNLQRIYKSSKSSSYNKYFLKGGRTKGLFYAIKGIREETRKIIIAEGVATALSIYLCMDIGKEEHQDVAVIAVFCASNIMHVVDVIDKKYKQQHVEIVIAADNDKWVLSEQSGKIEGREGNIGLKKAREVAKRYRGCKIVYPEFGEELKEHLPSDFNDMHKLLGKEAVKRAITNALSNNKEEEKSKGKNHLQDKKAREPTTKEKLLKLLSEYVYEYWHNRGRKSEGGVTMDIDGEYKHYLLCGNFKTYLVGIYYKKYKEAVSKKVIEEIMEVIKARAIFEGKGYEVYYRIATIKEREEKNRIYYNIGDSEVGEITGEKWAIVKMIPDVKFITSNAMRKQCMPKSNTPVNIGLLKEVTNCGSDKDFILIMVYLAYCLEGTAPYPILNINGEQGSGKSETCRKLVSLIDPNECLSYSVPEKEEDLHILAKRRGVLYFDNVSGINNKVSDWLCKLSTGAGSAKRALYTDDEEYSLRASAGIIINGINNSVERGDLLDRSITINLPALKTRKSPQELDKRFEEIKGEILGGLFDLVVCALKNKEKAKKVIDRKVLIPRMIDYVIFGTACEKLLGLEDGEFLRICQNKEEEGIRENLEKS